MHAIIATATTATKKSLRPSRDDKKSKAEDLHETIKTENEIKDDKKEIQSLANEKEELKEDIKDLKKDIMMDETKKEVAKANVSSMKDVVDVAEKEHLIKKKANEVNDKVEKYNEMEVEFQQKEFSILIKEHGLKSSLLKKKNDDEHSNGSNKSEEAIAAPPHSRHMDGKIMIFIVVVVIGIAMWEFTTQETDGSSTPSSEPSEQPGVWSHTNTIGDNCDDQCAKLLHTTEQFVVQEHCYFCSDDDWPKMNKTDSENFFPWKHYDINCPTTTMTQDAEGPYFVHDGKFNYTNSIAVIVGKCVVNDAAEDGKHAKCDLVVKGTHAAKAYRLCRCTLNTEC